MLLPLPCLVLPVVQVTAEQGDWCKIAYCDDANEPVAAWVLRRNKKAELLLLADDQVNMLDTHMLILTHAYPHVC